LKIWKKYGIFDIILPLIRPFFKEANQNLKSLIVYGLDRYPRRIALLSDLAFFHEFENILRLLISRRFGFHKSTLSKICRNLDIEYHHFPELGIPSTLRTSLNTKEDYSGLFRKYKNIIAKENKVIKQVTRLIETKPSVLACMEADFHLCHRKPLGKIIAKKTELPIIDLRK